MQTAAPPALPQPCNWSKQQVQLFASNLAEQFGFGPESEIEDVVQGLGGTVEHTDWNSAKQTGSLVVYGREHFTIFLSPYSGASRSRFTIAHEIGHYILHSRLGERPLTIRRDGSGRVEWEANWFAAGFLMPTKIFTEKVHEGLSEAELAVFFKVSRDAIQIRKENLGL